jgi:transketolase
LGWPFAAFEVPQDIKTAWSAREKGAREHLAWQRRFEAYGATYPDLAAEFSRRTAGELPDDFAERAQGWIEASARAADPVATRKASQTCIKALTAALPELLGGSADLTGSNLTNWKGCRQVGKTEGGNYIHYGVREFGMAAIMNGVALHGGYIPFGGTFLVFSDYARNALRLSALMRLRVIHVFTHDSIGLGEDGPTHQPIEHLASLRLMPNMDVWRPCDQLETAVAWRAAIERTDGPTSLVLSRQNLPPQAGTPPRAEHIARGGYILAEADGGAPDLVLIATGSEVALAMQARTQLAARDIRARVVSMPSTTVFDRQSEAYRAEVLPDGIKRLAVEAGAPDLWRKYVGLDGAVIGIDSYGESAPGPSLYAHFGFAPEHVTEVAAALL